MWLRSSCAAAVMLRSNQSKLPEVNVRDGCMKGVWIKFPLITITYLSEDFSLRSRRLPLWPLLRRAGPPTAAMACVTKAGITFCTFRHLTSAPTKPHHANTQLITHHSSLIIYNSFQLLKFPLLRHYSGMGKSRIHQAQSA